MVEASPAQAYRLDVPGQHVMNYEMPLAIAIIFPVFSCSCSVFFKIVKLFGREVRSSLFRVQSKLSIRIMKMGYISLLQRESVCVLLTEGDI